MQLRILMNINVVRATGINEPEGMRKEIQKTKALMPEGTPFGVDLLLPSAEEGARKTNKAVGNDTMDALVDVFIEEE